MGEETHCLTMDLSVILTNPYTILTIYHLTTRGTTSPPSLSNLYRLKSIYIL